VPFDEIDIWKDRVAYFVWNDPSPSWSLDIVVEPTSYSFEFWNRKDPKGTKGLAKAMLQKMGCLNEHTFGSGRFTKKNNFAFPSQEEKLFDHISTFKKKLESVVGGLNQAL
jgi:hypothetical protein